MTQNVVRLIRTHYFGKLVTLLKVVMRNIFKRSNEIFCHKINQHISTILLYVDVL
jgi:hypothetical protein